MIKYSILKNGIITNQYTSDIGNESYHEKCFGKKAGEYPLKELSSQELESEISRREDKTSLMSKVLVTIPQQYEIQIEDITEQLQKQKESIDALDLLNKTDYMVIRELETGVKMPEEIKEQRAQARLKVIK